MRHRMTLAAVLAVALAAWVATAQPAPRDPDGDDTGGLQLVATTTSTGSGQLLSNSLDGKAILTVVGLQPGQSRAGQVTLKNAGSAGLTVGVQQSGLTSGPTGRPNLAAWVQLTVYDATTNKTVYAGAYQNFPTSPFTLCGAPAGKASCPSWAKGETHVFTFTVTFPDIPKGGPVNVNTYQSTWLRSEFDWATAL